MVQSGWKCNNLIVRSACPRLGQIYCAGNREAQSIYVGVSQLSPVREVSVVVVVWVKLGECEEKAWVG